MADKIRICVLLFLVSHQAAILDADWEYSSFTGFSETSIVVVTREMLLSAPAWDSSVENLPVTLEKAVQISLKEMKKNRPLDDSLFYPMESIKLEKLMRNRWVWIVKYEVEHKEGSGKSGMQPFWQIVVTMDGKAIFPKTKKRGD